jgi:hypothetical protein
VTKRPVQGGHATAAFSGTTGVPALFSLLAHFQVVLS